MVQVAVRRSPPCPKVNGIDSSGIIGGVSPELRRDFEGSELGSGARCRIGRTVDGLSSDESTSIWMPTTSSPINTSREASWGLKAAGLKSEWNAMWMIRGAD